ncbi:MAG: DNA mismatch repair protein MutS, partial [Acidobacteria bacterium]|nr:DNA mismatch repair protein MutS [Acidobacteriota bacterium]
LNRDALARRARDWKALPAPWHPIGLVDHPYADDLDVFGHASLAQLLGPVRTPCGRETLTRWLLPAARVSRGLVEARQSAVRELTPMVDFRQQFAGEALAVPVPVSVSVSAASAEPRDVAHVIRWAEAASASNRPVWLALTAAVFGAATTAGALASFFGLTPDWWVLTAAAGWALRWWWRDPIEQTFAGAAGEYGLRPWAPLIDLVTRQSWSSPLLVQAQADLGGDHRPAPQALRALERLVGLSDVRHSVWLYVPLQTLTLWDLHVWWALDRWRGRHGRSVRRWLDVVGRVEAVTALASVAFDQPTWTFPEIDDDLARIEADSLGHPLLADASRVTNDATIGPPGRFLLITGSNMSGKSTLLRAVGLNVVLAQAGGPVCATRFRLPPLALHTSMRISDSLELGLSLFMASLVRLQGIVTAARAAGDDWRVCYLLDEVLQGTNSAERQVAVRTIMRHLLSCHAIGAVTTHDLELAREPSFAAQADSFHLQETLGGTAAAVTMSFDYRLRPGPAQAGNAMQLLRMLGLADY